MSLRGQRIRYEPLRSLAFGSISGTYAAVGTPFDNAVRLLMIDNLTDANLTISFDGINDHLIIASSSGRVIDYATNRVGPVDQLEQAEGTILYVKGDPSVGSIYVAVVYAASN
jgi:hypothetical protein